MSPLLDGSGKPSNEPLALHWPLLTASSREPFTLTLNVLAFTGGYSLAVMDDRFRWADDEPHDLYGTATSHSTTEASNSNDNTHSSSRRMTAEGDERAGQTSGGKEDVLNNAELAGMEKRQS